LAKSSGKQILRRAALFLAVLFALFGTYLMALEATGNFHTVFRGELYRSAQPMPQQIDDYARLYGIKTIINLRGGSSDSEWYREEVAESKALGITHIDFPMSSGQELTQKQAAQLIEIMRTAEKPLLIHCRRGADRTGLASALYVAAIKKMGESRAEAQLLPIYGHLSIPFTPPYAMDRTWQMVETSLRLNRN
jgi:protein tyrosine/serine phosphatase